MSIKTFKPTTPSRRHMTVSVARAQRPQAGIQLSVRPALNDHPAPVTYLAVKLLRVLNEHANAAVTGVGTNASGSIGAMDAELPPRHVQSQKTGAESAKFSCETMGNIENPDRRGRFPSARGNGVALEHFCSLIKRQRLLG